MCAGLTPAGPGFRARAPDCSARACGRNAVHVGRLDLADQAPVAVFAADWIGPRDLLIGNAGVILPGLRRTPEGWEMTFATNHLGHFALAFGLHNALATAGGARIVPLNSAGHRRSAVIAATTVLVVASPQLDGIRWPLLRRLQPSARP